MSYSKPLENRPLALPDPGARLTQGLLSNEHLHDSLHHETRIKWNCDSQGDEAGAGTSAVRLSALRTPEFRTHVMVPERVHYQPKTSFKSPAVVHLKTPRPLKYGRAHLVPAGGTGQNIQKCLNYSVKENGSFHFGRRSAGGVPWESNQMDTLLKVSLYGAASVDKLTFPRRKLVAPPSNISGAPKGGHNPRMNSSRIFSVADPERPPSNDITGCNKRHVNANPGFSSILGPDSSPHKARPIHKTMCSHLQPTKMGMVPSEDAKIARFDATLENGRKHFTTANMSNLAPSLIPCNQGVDQFLVGHPTRSAESVNKKLKDVLTTGLQRGLCRMPSHDIFAHSHVEYQSGNGKSGKRHYAVPWSDSRIRVEDANPNYVKL